MQHPLIRRVNGLKNMSVSPWRRFGQRVVRVVAGSDHTCASNMVAVVNGRAMVFDTHLGMGKWVYGPTVEEALKERPGEVLNIGGGDVPLACLRWCDDYLIGRGVKPFPEHQP